VPRLKVGAHAGGDLAPTSRTRQSSEGTPAQVERILENPPYWLAGSYLPAYRRGRYSLAGLAYAVTAALKLSPYDDGVVDEVAKIMRGLGYRDSCAPKAFGRSLTELGETNAEDTAWM